MASFVKATIEQKLTNLEHARSQGNMWSLADLIKLVEHPCAYADCGMNN
jgi:hypothetical protein